LKPSLSIWQGTKGSLGSGEAQASKVMSDPIGTHLMPFFYKKFNFNLFFSFHLSGRFSSKIVD
jgi:hypothetical protein